LQFLIHLTLNKIEGKREEAGRSIGKEKTERQTKAEQAI
jgi:hypothetical protein